MSLAKVGIQMRVSKKSLPWEASFGDQGFTKHIQDLSRGESAAVLE